MSAELLSYDIFISHYKKQCLLFRDLHRINLLARKEKWNTVLDFQAILLNQEKAIQITNQYGKVLFTSSNFNRFTMELTKSCELYANKPGITRYLFIYSLQYNVSIDHVIHNKIILHD